MVTVRQGGNAWIPQVWSSPHTTIRLFALPYAGGGAAIYSGWGERLGRIAEVCPVELPGRGRRIGDPAIGKMSELVAALVEALAGRLDLPFALWGHSMGSLIAYETARYLRRHGLPRPSHLFVAASRAPQLPKPHLNRHLLRDAEFVDTVKKLKGPGAEVLDNPELQKLLVPTLRADFEIVDTYSRLPDQPLDVPISAYGAIDDSDVDVDALEQWRAHTTSAFALRLFSGGHFFIHSATASVLDTLQAELIRLTRRESTGLAGLTA